jgi:leucyl-tRNA synthetase
LEDNEPKRTGHSSLATGHSPPGVDLYVGGAEHAVLHLLYARFWHKVLYDLGHVSTPEPFGKLFNQGYIQAYAYTDARGVYVPAEEVVEKDGGFFYGDMEVTREFGKMGKSLKNAVGPDEIAEQYGCDTLRLYEMYLGPLEQSKVWNTQDIVGVHRFLNRLWRNLIDTDTGELLVDDTPPDAALAKQTHKTIAKVTEAMSSMGFNVAIAAMIELNNALVPMQRVPRWVAEQLVLMLSPLAPHICEELWEKLGHERSLAYEPWPSYDPDLLVEDEVELPVQVMGKVRGRITVPRDADEATVLEAAKADPNVAAHLEGKTIHKTIVVPGKMVNLVAK